MFTEINKFPFTEKSTLRLTSLNYTLPLNVFIDANFYPTCQNNAPFHINELSKIPEAVIARVADSTNSYVFDIILPLKADVSNHCIGTGVQGGRYCGSCLCSKEAYDFFDSIPSITSIDSDSLVFSASAVRPISVEMIQTGTPKYEGKIVKNCVWGDNLAGGTVVTTVIELEEEKEQPIHTVVVNNIPLQGENLFITPVKQGVIRVVNASDITIGRLTDL